jgi:hypothetical protein
MCKTNAATATGGMGNVMCISCACDANPGTIDACNKAPMCWPLISCVRACLAANPMMTQTMCATSAACMGFVTDGAATATPAGMILSGATCASKCSTAADGGVDAGN